MSEESASEDDSSHKDSLLITRASRRDLDAVFQIYNENRDYIDPEGRDWLEKIVESRSKRIRIYVLKDRDEVAGFALVFRKRGLAYIDALALKRSYRGRGLGSHFLRSLESMLRRENVEKIFLTVKHNNVEALTFYLKNMYKVKSMVLLMKIEDPWAELDHTVPHNGDTKVIYRSSKAITRKKLLDSVFWNVLTEEADDLIYRKSREKRYVVYVYKDGNLVGVVEYFINTRSITIERFAVSYYRPPEAVKTLINAMLRKFVRKGLHRKYREITLPIDASKTSLIRSLTEMSFRVFDVEYVLYKDLVDRSEEILR